MHKMGEITFAVLGFLGSIRGAKVSCTLMSVLHMSCLHLLNDVIKGQIENVQ